MRQPQLGAFGCLARASRRSNRTIGSVDFDVIGILAELEEDQIKETLTTESWEEIKPILDRVRAIGDNNQL